MIPIAQKYVAKSNPNAVKPVANNSNKDISLQKQLDMIDKSIKDLSNQQKLLAAAVVPLATLNNKDKLAKFNSAQTLSYYSLKSKQSIIMYKTKKNLLLQYKM